MTFLARCTKLIIYIFVSPHADPTSPTTRTTSARESARAAGLCGKNYRRGAMVRSIGSAPADSEGTQARLRQSGPADRMDTMQGTGW
jgi:hypothetical protein